MTATLRSEIRKLLTTRSTYIITILSLLLNGFIAFYIEGLKGAAHPNDANKLTGVLLGFTPLIAQLGAIVAILYMGHEFRYNLIAYALTFSNSRSKLLLAKILTISLFIAIFALLNGFVATTLTHVGAQVGNINLPPQSFDALSLFGRSILYCLGYGLAAMMVATLFRNIVAAVAFVFIIPGTIEALLTLVLKNNAVYLPFSALQQVIAIAGDQRTFTESQLSPLKGGLVFGAYLLAGWIITWIIFLRRDAT